MITVTLKTIVCNVAITYTSFLVNDEGDVPPIKVRIFHRLSVYHKGS